MRHVDSSPQKVPGSRQRCQVSEISQLQVLYLSNWFD
jgi:hypothetical protein